MKITIFGTGYVGLVTGACLADVGHEVLCLDVDEERINQLEIGKVPIYEPGLARLVKDNVTAGRLSFTCDPTESVAFGSLQFIAVNTPPLEDGDADLEQVLAVARTIGEQMYNYKAVVIKSTVPVGTADRVSALLAAVLASRGQEVAFDVCVNPEFLREGTAIDDFTRGPRILVGTDSPTVRELMRECYVPYIRLQEKLMFMEVRAAELTKYATNAMLATKISVMNEIANLAERLGADVEQVRRGVGSDPRIGYQGIYPGCGYGGPCLSPDMQALARAAEQVHYPAELLNTVEAVNRRQKTRLFHRLNEVFDGDLAGRTIALWGLAFKPGTDDMRDAPSCTLMEALWEAGATVQAYDPRAMGECRRRYGERDDLVLVADRIQAVKGADALAICTEWPDFRAVDFTWLRQQLRHPVVVDGRNLYDPQAAREAGLRYYAMGRGDSLRVTCVPKGAENARR